MTQPPGTESAAPSVGNVLGFALEFADRRALLKLDRRVLGPGVVLSDFSAEIPGVRFPVQHPVSVGSFRSRRCRTLHADLRLDTRHLAQRLTSVVQGLRIGTFVLREADLVPGDTSRSDEVDLWCHLVGRHDDGRTIEIALGLSTATGERTVRVSLVHSWVFSDIAPPPEVLWSALAGALRPGATTELELDPLGQTLVRGFSRAGWKAPDLARLVIEQIELEDGGLRLRYCQRQLASPARPARPRPERDPIAEAIDAVRDHLAASREDEATSSFERLLASVRPHRVARLAAARWLVQSLRHRDAPAAAELCLSALAGWLRLRPDDARARRWFVETLARRHRFEELAQFTRASSKSQTRGAQQARCDLAVALLMIDHLGDRGRARALLAPWVSELDRTPDLSTLRIPLRTALAKARADTPRAAVRTLHEVLALIEDPPGRATARLAVARSLLDADAPNEALQLIREAAKDAPEHPQLEELTRRLTVVVDPGAAAIPQPDPPPAVEAAAKEALARGDLPRASELLLRLRTAASDPSDEARLRLARTDVLVRLEKFGRVWSELGPALEVDGIPARDQALRWGIEFAPSRTAQALASQLAAEASPAASVEALEARWARWGSVDSAARALVDRLESQGSHDRARQLCLQFAEQAQADAAVAWLVRAASHAPAKDAATLLSRALEHSGSDAELERQLEEALRESGSLDALHALWQRQAHDEQAAEHRRLKAIDRLIAFRLADQEPTAAGRADVELLELCRLRFSLGPAHRVANLILADEARRAGDAAAVREHLGRALELMGKDDPRRTRPALELANLALEEGQLDEARELAESSAKIDPTPEAWSLLKRVARTSNDDALLCVALEGSVLRAVDPVQEAQERLELGRALCRLGRLEEAVEQFESAAATVEARSPVHAQIAEAWVAAARDGRGQPAVEARARAELRAAFGTDLPSKELEAEARLRADALEDIEGALAIVEAGLEARPSEPVLLSALKDLSVRVAAVPRYAGALERAVATMPPGQPRDTLLLELAAVAVDGDAAPDVLTALDRLSASASGSAEALDLRSWAVSRLGAEDDELAAINERLRAAPGDPSALARLRRALPDPSNRADHLLRTASHLATPDAAALVRAAAETLRGQRDPTTILRAMKRAVELGLPLEDVVADAVETWRNAVAAAVVDGDEVTVAELVEFALQDAAPHELAEAGQRGLDDALAALIDAPRLVALLWTRSEMGGPGADRRALQRIDDIAKRSKLDASARSRLLIALTNLMPAESARAVLEAEAARAPADPERIELFVDALQRHGHIPELLRLLERRLEQADDAAERVVLLKRLGHLYGDAAADPQRRAEALRRALELAPTDPDLLLPLLDHSFDAQDLPRAVELATRVLDDVSMGTIAYVSLAHRTADAALALGDPEASAAVLRRATQRDPDDERTRTRLAEVEDMRGDPAQRVVLLGVVADRQSGPARFEALEEKARLLADPLGRTDEAVATLEQLLAESPGHATAVEMLRQLYPTVGMWRRLADLLEGEVPQTHGVARCELLRELASIYREHLLDAPRAEHTLRIALDHLGESEATVDLAETIRADLVSNLEAQGRYVDLSIYLERALSPELEGRVDSDALHPLRGDLLVHLARVFRGPLDNESKAGRVYERLEQLGRLPDEGLATLAKIFHRSGRHADLVRILRVRSRTLAEHKEWARKASVDHRIGELLEGPLGRPHEAPPHYLDAYLASPTANEAAGKRARILLAGTDAVVNVRAELLRRLDDLHGHARPALLTLLADVLGPHEEYEHEAEAAYREALELAPEHGPAQEALGRLLARQGRLEDAVGPLEASARNASLAGARAAENAAICARALLELDRVDEAESLLKAALQRTPDSQRALLELARLYEKTKRVTEQAIVLESLSELPISSMLAAEVSYRRAALLMPAARRDAFSSEAERARAYLLEAVSSDANTWPPATR